MTIQIDDTNSEVTFEVDERRVVHFDLRPGGRARYGASDLAWGAQWVSITRTDEP